MTTGEVRRPRKTVLRQIARLAQAPRTQVLDRVDLGTGQGKADPQPYHVTRQVVLPKPRRPPRPTLEARVATYPLNAALAGEPFHCCCCGLPGVTRGVCKWCDDEFALPDGLRPVWLADQVRAVCKANMRVIRNARRLQGTATPKDGRYPGVEIVSWADVGG